MAAVKRISARSFARLVLPAILLTLSGHAPTGAQAPIDPLPSAAAAQDEALASLRKEVRFRKLHLVRPDLIQYPLAYDVYC